MVAVEESRHRLGDNEYGRRGAFRQGGSRPASERGAAVRPAVTCSAPFDAAEFVRLPQRQ